jgi:nucleoside 2-deoxyribosyltransferase
VPVNVFLSGAIEGCIEFGRAWREDAKKLLLDSGYNVLNPMDVALEDEGCAPDEIVEKNLFMQRRADLLLVEYQIEDRCYIGTDYEMTWAKMHGQPIIVFCNNENKNRVYLRYLATKIAPTIEDAVEYIRSNYPTNYKKDR